MLIQALLFVAMLISGTIMGGLLMSLRMLRTMEAQEREGFHLRTSLNAHRSLCAAQRVKIAQLEETIAMYEVEPFEDEDSDDDEPADEEGEYPIAKWPVFSFFSVN
jgi:hypothetical protein